MMLRWLKAKAAVFFCTGVVFLALFGSCSLSFSSPECLQFLAREIQTACRDAWTQWMVVVCLLSYFIVFAVLEAKSKAQSLKSKVATHSEVSDLNSEVKSCHSSRVTRHFFRNPDFWLAAFVVLVLLRYAVDYTNAVKSLQVVVLLTGIVIGQGIVLWVARKPSPSLKSKVQSLKPGEVSVPSSIFYLPFSSRSFTVVGLLVFLLTVASLWHPEHGMEFFYRGQKRWTGPWDNPNLYGVLMGVGTILAIGLLVSSLRSQVQSRGTKVESREPDEVGRITPCAPEENPTCNLQPVICNAAHWLNVIFFLSATVLCAYGLLKSYSRGAWLGTVLGLGFFVWKWINQIHLTPALSHLSADGERELFPHPSNSERPLSTLHSQPSTTALISCVSWLRHNWFSFSILILSLLVICFWQFRHTEAPLARRMFSVGNVNDFSWRNRVAAWEGAGRMMLVKPFAGFGWGKAEEVYSKQYRAARLEDSAAIQLNDYLMIGISVGVPALGCLLAYLALTWFQVSGFRFQGMKAETLDFGPKTLDSVPTICFGSVIILTVGFWFDGGLFKLPTAVVFWMLVEQARKTVIPVCQFGRFSSHPIQEHLAEKHGTGKSREPAGGKTCPIIILRGLAGLVAVVALALTALHLIAPQLVVSERTLFLARRFIVPTREQSDFEYLAAKNIWPGQPLKILLQHAQLANYNRTLVNWKLDDQIYREFVLSPEITPLPGLVATLFPSDGERDGVRGVDEMNWRRPLWEFFYPRIRKEGSLEAAAEIVIRRLREHVKTNLDADVPAFILESWERGVAGEANFQMLAVAALRSVGIPGRLSASGVAEFWTGAEWEPAMTVAK